MVLLCHRLRDRIHGVDNLEVMNPASTVILIAALLLTLGLNVDWKEFFRPVGCPHCGAPVGDERYRCPECGLPL